MSQDPPCLRAFRDEIALRTVQEAQRLFPQAIKFHYNTAVTNVDFKKQLVHISMAGSSTTEVCIETTPTQDGKVYTAFFDPAKPWLSSSSNAGLSIAVSAAHLPDSKISHWPICHLICNALFTVLPVFVVYTNNNMWYGICMTNKLSTSASICTRSGLPP